METEEPEKPKEKKKTLLTPVETRVVENHVAIAADPPKEIVYQHTVLCQICLPYRDPGPDIREWERRQGEVALRVEAGAAIHPQSQEFVKLGLPFGPKVRLVLHHLNTEALKNGSPVIEVEDSMTAFVSRIQRYAPNGAQIRTLKDQLARLSAATIRMATVQQDRAYQINSQIVTAFDLWFPKDARQRVLWPSTIRLSDEYFNGLAKHAVPLDERAVAALSHSAMALDVYCWLAQRLHRVDPKREQFITWVALQAQFGHGYARTRAFRAAFIKVLRVVKLAYPAARFVTNEKGMTLGHSQPPVQRRAIIQVPPPLLPKCPQQSGDDGDNSCG